MSASQVSYWKQGADHARAGLPPLPPTSDGVLTAANRGYLNGYHFAKTGHAPWWSTFGECHVCRRATLSTEGSQP